jgi:hypothetical protein
MTVSARRGAGRAVSALRDASAFGLRRRELVILDPADFGANPHAVSCISHAFQDSVTVWRH